jgi:hypothetical protein
MPSRMSRIESVGPLKGKDSLARSFSGNWLLEPLCRGKIHVGAQYFCEAVFNGNHVQKRQAPFRRELGYDIHVRHLADGVPPAYEPCRNRCSMPAALSSLSCSRNLAMIVDLSIPQPYRYSPACSSRREIARSIKGVRRSCP